MKTAAAWILPITPSASVAVGEFELLHVLPDPPELFAIPQAPGYCTHVFVWQQVVVPLMDIAQRFYAPQAPKEHEIIVICPYRTGKGGELKYGALSLAGMPQRVEVGDSDACPLQDSQLLWKAFAVSCFRLPDSASAIPVVSLSRLFARMPGKGR